jgi:hypothetical protein
MKCILVKLQWPIFILVALLGAESAFAQGAARSISCDVAIVGGGAGGLHTAFRLGPALGNKVCLFEKEEQLGGRILDVSLTPGGPVFGLGALRIMETQDVVFNLADELQIQYEAVPYKDEWISARGLFAHTSDALLNRYLDVLQSEGDLYDTLLSTASRQHEDVYPDFRSYVLGTVGAESYHFLTDMSRFRGDYTYPLSARGYLDFLAEEWDVCCTPSYPVGGMSEFIKRMEGLSLGYGVRIYRSEPALKISSGPGKSRYRIVTPNYMVSANRIVIAVDAWGLRKIGGDIAARIHAQAQFQDLTAIKVASIDQWWGTAWWQNAIPGKDLNRAWTTEHCLNFIEIPSADYAARQKVTRSVYVDRAECVDFWEITAARGIPQVEAEIKRGLESLFPGVTIPAPLNTAVKIWPNAWYWLRAGSPYTNADIATWAIAPLPGEQVSLVGESYNPQRSTWSDGAFKSSINTLNAVFGLSLDGQTASLDGPLSTFKKVKSSTPGLRGKR